MWQEPDLLLYIRYAMNFHFFAWILVWLTQHRLENRTIPGKLFAWQVFTYWVGLGFIYGILLYRPYPELASRLKDELWDIPDPTYMLFGALFVIAEFFNLYFHFQFSYKEVESAEQLPLPADANVDPADMKANEALI
jgi:hypothetical protein